MVAWNGVGAGEMGRNTAGSRTTEEFGALAPHTLENPRVTFDSTNT